MYVYRHSLEIKKAKQRLASEKKKLQEAKGQLLFSEGHLTRLTQEAGQMQKAIGDAPSDVRLCPP